MVEPSVSEFDDNFVIGKAASADDVFEDLSGWKMDTGSEMEESEEKSVILLVGA